MRYFPKTKEGENYNPLNTSEYFEDYDFDPTQRWKKTAVPGQPPGVSDPQPLKLHGTPPVPKYRG